MKYVFNIGTDFQIKNEIPPLSKFPNIYVCYDSYKNTGLSTSYCLDARKAMIGEMIERQYFKSHIQRNHLGLLKNNTSQKLYNSLLHLLQQTSKKPNSFITNYEFELSPCINLCNGKKEYVPFILLTLGKSKDEFIVPYRDSSGSSSHLCPHEALKTAFLEFIERQCLTASWLSKQCEYLIETHDIKNNLKNFPTVINIINELTMIGNIYLAQISCRLGGYVILAVYSAHSVDEHVKFSIGCAAALSPIDAICKALIEMYQTYSLMMGLHSKVDKNFYERERNKYPRIIRNFAVSNSLSTVQEFGFFSSEKKNAIPLKKYISLPPTTIDIILKNIQKISNNILYYTHSFEYAKNIHIISKVLSPDFYVIMDNGEKINFDNKFSSYLGINQEMSNKLKPLPFA